MKRLISIPVLLAFFAANLLILNELAAFFCQDSFPKIYKGYRLSLYNFEVKGESKKGTEVVLSVANTGRLPLIFSEKAPAPLELVVELDTPSLPARLRGREELIVFALLDQKINIAPGKFKTEITLKVPFEKTERPPKMASKTPPKQVEKVAEKEAKKEPKKDEMPKAEIAENTPKPTEKAEKITEKQPKEPKKDKTPKAEKPEKIAEKTPEKSTENSNKADAENSAIRNPQSAISSKLPDLVIDSAWVVKREKKRARVALIIKNQGEATARLGGKSPKKSTDNLAVNAYFSSSKKLSRGAMLADGIFIDESAGNGLLLPTERFYVEMEVPLEAQTKFTGFIILEIDPFGTVDERDKTNNTRAVLSEKTQ